MKILKNNKEGYGLTLVSLSSIPDLSCKCSYQWKRYDRIKFNSYIIKDYLNKIELMIITLKGELCIN